MTTTTTLNPCDPTTERTAWLRWQISDELATSIAPGLREGSASARATLVEWLTHDRVRLVSHCHGAMGACARHAGIERFTREEVAYEIDLVAWAHKVSATTPNLVSVLLLIVAFVATLLGGCAVEADDASEAPDAAPAELPLCDDLCGEGVRLVCDETSCACFVPPDNHLEACER